MPDRPLGYYDAAELLRADFAGEERHNRRQARAELVDERDHVRKIHDAIADDLVANAECACPNGRDDLAAMVARGLRGENTECPVHADSELARRRAARSADRGRPSTPLNAPIADLIGDALGGSFVPDDAA